jgi:hypothetical protein
MLIAVNGQKITDKMLTGWTDALSNDEWPTGEISIGPVIKGRPRLSAENTTVLSLKIAPAMKRIVENSAKTEGISTSEYVRNLILHDIMLK